MRKKANHYKERKVYPERLFVARVYDRKKNVVKVYRYSNPDKALLKLALHALKYEPGYVIELTHEITSNWIATVKVRVNGKLETSVVWDQKTWVWNAKEKV
jgi:hypothetical protein